MAYTPCYPNKRNWANLPSESSPINETNLNAMDNAIYTNDGRIVELSGRLDTDETALGNKVDKQSGKGLSEIKSITISPSVNTGTKIAEISYKNQDNLTIGYEIKNGVVVDSALSGSSTNPVQNKVVKSALDGKSTVSIANTLPTGDTIANLTINGTTTAIKAPLVEVDDELSTSSTNPVQNKIITEALREIMPEVTVTGNPISISDGSNVVPAKLAEVTFLPKQDLHGYDSPWVGGAGKNKAKGLVVQTGQTGTVTKINETYTMSSTGFFIDFKLSANTNYTLSFKFVSGRISNIRTYTDMSATTQLNEYGTYITADYSRNIRETSDCYVRIWCSQETKISDVQLELGTTATAFAPYENICPISGWTELNLNRCGKNIVNEVHHGNMNSNGSYGTGNTRVTNATSATSSVIKVKAGKYTISAIGLDYATVLTKDNSGSIVDNFAGSWHALPYTFTITQTANLYFTARKSDNTSITLSDVSVQIEEGETATSYEAYNGQTYTEPLGSTYYGGKVDFVSGGATSEIGIYTITEISSLSVSGGNYYATFAISGIKSVGVRTKDVICECVPQIDALGDYLGIYHIGSNVVICVGSSYTVSDFNQNIAGHKVAYPLATPIELTLTPQEIDLLKGANVLWTDGESIKLVYSADIAQYIANQLNS